MATVKPAAKLKPPILNVNTIAEEPQTQRWMLIAVAVLGIVAAALATAAEVTRTKKYVYVMDYEQRFHCQYPASQATYLAIGAVVLLLAAQVLTLYQGGIAVMFSGPKYFLSRMLLTAMFLCILCLGSLVIAIGTLVAGAVENMFHTTATSGGFTTLRCSIVTEGTFLSGAVFSLVAVVLMECFYLYAVKARWELWRTSAAYGGTPTAESELTTGQPTTSEHPV